MRSRRLLAGAAIESIREALRAPENKMNCTYILQKFYAIPSFHFTKFV
ncbi:hypothetical protein HMPREF3293_01279 [Christensenella minuta]|jgi:hypothetical protein|uniref:Uncharacterized protein n=1 Tax=Christensenella minuta TaxID=626937 RepID=A0A136Q5F9_9FIRM|nr:hypothetical protein HMPREF3293_01279 [Christensenella minuta]